MPYQWRPGGARYSSEAPPTEVLNVNSGIRNDTYAQPMTVVDGQAAFAKSNPVRPWQPTMFERVLFVIFAALGSLTCIVTLYVYLEIYRLMLALGEAIQKFQEGLTGAGGF